MRALRDVPAAVDVDRRFSIQLVESAPQEAEEIEVALDEDDVIRADVIQALMCHGALDYDALGQRHMIDFRDYFADALAQTGGRRLILSTGCVTMTNSPLSNLSAARQSVASLAS